MSRGLCVVAETAWSRSAFARKRPRALASSVKNLPASLSASSTLGLPWHSKRWLSGAGPTTSSEAFELPDWARARILRGAQQLPAALQKANEVLDTVSPDSSAYVRAAREAGRLDSLCEMHRKLESSQELVKTLQQEVEAYRDEPEFADLAREELAAAEEAQQDIEQSLVAGLLPRESDDDANAIIEVRPGVGGSEASIFAEEIYTMYQRMAGLKEWQWETLTERYKDHGLREGVALVSGEGAYGCLKFESGVHRVQRVPATESSGRIHTSTVTVVVLPEVDEADVELNPADLRIDVFRASGAGGQHVNTTESAVRITHVPSGLTVSIQDERSQHQNRAKAMKIIAARVKALVKEEEQQKQQGLRKDLVATGDRSEKIRTYNYARDQCVDHRVSGAEVRGLDNMLKGTMDLDRNIWGPLRVQSVLTRLEEEADSSPDT
mmetsp:Transcript_2626/g.6132  ORF Transcript_2626/g.6132 Transcript_2626/m.6132 type:complete len:438 (-) Transcript_2626:318-1631(-)